MLPTGRLTYANIVSTLALVVALGGGGAAVAVGLAKDSVGSPQIVNGAVKTVDLGANAVTGPKIKESTLGKVPTASRADDARRLSGRSAQSFRSKVAAVGSVQVGTYSVGGEFNGGSPITQGITYPEELPHALAADRFEFVNYSGPTVNCPGPGRVVPLGYLCIYETYGQSSSFRGAYRVATSGELGSDSIGFGIIFGHDCCGSPTSFGSCAVKAGDASTAPQPTRN